MHSFVQYFWTILLFSDAKGAIQRHSAEHMFYRLTGKLPKLKGDMCLIFKIKKKRIKRIAFNLQAIFTFTTKISNKLNSILIRHKIWTYILFQSNWCINDIQLIYNWCINALCNVQTVKCENYTTNYKLDRLWSGRKIVRKRLCMS